MRNLLIQLALHYSSPPVYAPTTDPTNYWIFVVYNISIPEIKQSLSDPVLGIDLVRFESFNIS